MLTVAGFGVGVLYLWRFVVLLIRLQPLQQRRRGVQLAAVDEIDSKGRLTATTSTEAKPTPIGNRRPTGAVEPDRRHFGKCRGPQLASPMQEIAMLSNPARVS